jgi:Zn2+/Cd2+-exporting ATPase
MSGKGRSEVNRMGQKKEYILEGLCCANCAAKIEKAVGELPEVKEISLNLMNSKLSVRLNDTQTLDITDKIIGIVTMYEESVKVKDLSDQGDKKSHTDESADKGEFKLFLLRLLAAVGIMALFFFLKVPAGIRLAAYIVAYLLVGFDVLLSAIKNIIKGKLFDENFLMGFASLGAFLMGDYLEAVAVLVFYGVGELLQDMAVGRSRKNITGLMDIRPDYANRMDGDSISIVAPDLINTGDMILVKPGEKIPLDGAIVKGSSFLDTKALTGESVPREVNPGDEVMSGSINNSGVLEIRVTKPYGESTVSKILELVQNAGSKKAESEKFITKFARYYTPAVVGLAVAVAVFPPILGFDTFTVWLYRALSFLIISCPCALVISIPLSFFGGIGGAAKHGILVKGGNYLDALNQVDTIVFDKTGTLTKGVFEVSEICPANETDASELISLAALAESNSTHPIAKSIISYATCNGIASELRVDQVKEVAGKGVIAETATGTIYAGNDKLMKAYDINVEQSDAAGSIIHIAFNRKYVGYILISDRIKAEAAEAITALKHLGVRKTVMLTGDLQNVAKKVSRLCGIDEYEAELLPQDKVRWFEKYKVSAGNGKIVFVGDGINDAPVLAGADIGIAMGGIGSDAAIEAADVVIMNDDITKIATAIRIAKKTKRIVYQNIVFALGVKLLIMILAFLGLSSIWFAIFADVGVAMLALMNAMRAMYLKK